MEKVPWTAPVEAAPGASDRAGHFTPVEQFMLRWDMRTDGLPVPSSPPGTAPLLSLRLSKDVTALTGALFNASFFGQRTLGMLLSDGRAAQGAHAAAPPIDWVAFGSPRTNLIH